jgi:hypothetical protein
VVSAPQSRLLAKDQQLVLVVRAADPSAGWTEIAQEHFSNRHPQCIVKRWSELATDQNIPARSCGRPTMIMGVRTNMHRRRTSSGGGTPYGNTAEDDKVNDFVVQV